jgi:ribosomal protein L14E/L6E/L27E
MTPQQASSPLARPLVVGMIVAVVRGAYAGHMGQVVRSVHEGTVMIKLTLTGAVLPFGPSELR